MELTQLEAVQFAQLLEALKRIAMAHEAIAANLKELVVSVKAINSNVGRDFSR